MSVTALTNDNFDQEVLASDKTILIDFWAAWCGPCKMLSPVIDQLADEVDDSVKVCKVNVDEQSELASQFQVRSIPTLVVIKDGKVTNVSVGVKSKEEILAML
ncbi:MAG: thioredoxin [Clostridiales bacterium]|nr:thioredoxin [Clostridiales bacterium]